MAALLILGLVALLAGLAGYFWSKAQKADAGAEQALREFAALLPALKDDPKRSELEPECNLRPSDTETALPEPVSTPIEPEPAPYVVLDAPADVPPAPEPVVEPETCYRCNECDWSTDDADEAVWHIFFVHDQPAASEPAPAPTPEPYEPSRFIAAIAHASRSITRMVTSTPPHRTSHRHRHRHRQG